MGRTAALLYSLFMTGCFPKATVEPGGACPTDSSNATTESYPRGPDDLRRWVRLGRQRQALPGSDVGTYLGSEPVDCRAEPSGAAWLHSAAVRWRSMGGGHV